MFLAVVLILTACGGSGGTTAQSSIQPSSNPTGAGLLFAVVEGGSGENPDTVAIVGLDGNARASAKFQPRNTIDAGGSAIERNYVPLQGVAQVTGAGVFYIDGYGTVRVLRVAAQPQVVATFPRQPAQYETWFAVSPDGSSVVAGTLQFSDVGLKFSYAIAPAGGQATVLRQRDANPIPDGVIAFPVGWITSGPVAMVPVTVLTQTGWSGGPLYLVDAKGALSTRLGGSDCDSASITESGLIPCVGSSVRDSTGSVIWVPKQMGGVDARELYISPDGQAIADGGAASPLYGSQVETRGGGMVQVPPGYRVEGWLDANTLVGRVIQANGGMGHLSWVTLGQPAVLHDLGFPGDFVATLA